MKKILIILNLIILLTLSSCFPTYVFTNNFSNKVLKDCGIEDFISPVDALNVDATSNATIKFETTKEGFLNNVSNVYDYLKEKRFKYYGFKGECLSSLFGAMPEYAFYKSSSLEEHIYVNEHTGFKDENTYTFVWSNEINEGNILINDVELTINYINNICTMDIDYDANTLSSFRFVENRNYYIGYLYPWLENLNSNVKSIKTEWIENNLKTCVKYSNDNLSYLNTNMLVKKYDANVENINVVKCEYEMIDGSINIINCINGYLLIDGQYYVHIDGYDFGLKDIDQSNYVEYTFFDDSLYEIPSYSFHQMIYNISLNEITYISTDYINEKAIYSIDTPYGRINIYKKDIFDINGKYYKIISDKNFEILFEYVK